MQHFIFCNKFSRVPKHKQVKLSIVYRPTCVIVKLIRKNNKSHSCTHIHTHTYTHTRMHAHTHIHTHAHMHTYTHTHAHSHTYIYFYQLNELKLFGYTWPIISNKSPQPILNMACRNNYANAKNVCKVLYIDACVQVLYSESTIFVLYNERCVCNVRIWAGLVILMHIKMLQI